MAKGKRRDQAHSPGGLGAPPPRRVTADLRPLTLDRSCLARNARILVAVSGGADSIALLHALHAAAPRFGWRLTVAHLHHGIRGRAADDDAAFVRRTAAGLRVPCVTGKVRVPSLARRQGISLEMAAREARYAFLARAARQAGADVIATAHTADDQAETLLLKLIRGAGRAGLAGIPGETRRQGQRVVRPLLQVTRADIRRYLQRRALTWREDESNADPIFLRNRVRHELLPFLERGFNPRIRETLVRTGEILGAEEDWLAALTADLFESCLLTETEADEASCRAAGQGSPPALIESAAVDTRRLCTLWPAARRRVVRLWLTRSGAPESSLGLDTVDRITALCARRHGSHEVTLGEGWSVKQQYQRLVVVRPSGALPAAFRVEVRVPGATALPDQGLRVITRLAPGLSRERASRPGRLPACASLSVSAWNGRPLFVRSWRRGDRMAPFGMKGSKKIQDILVDAKVPRDERCRIPILVCEEELVWLPGYRVADAWAVKLDEDVSLQIEARPLSLRKR